MIGAAFLRAAMAVLLTALAGYKWIIFVRALVSWVSPDPRNPIVRALGVLTEPALRPFRRLVPPARTGGLDLSPVFAFLFLLFLELFVQEVYHSYFLGRPI
jgi:YggT family protein